MEGKKDIRIRRHINEEERNEVKELIVEAQSINEVRTQEQAEVFWRVVDLKVRKWWYKEATEVCQAGV